MNETNSAQVVTFIAGSNNMHVGHGQSGLARHIVAATGGVLLLAGLVGIGWVFALGNKDEPYLLQMSTTTLLVGVVLISQSILLKRPAADDQTYRMGYDMGYEAGERDERERNRPKLVKGYWRR